MAGIGRAAGATAALLTLAFAFAVPSAVAATGVIVYEQFLGSGTNHQSDIWMVNADGTGDPVNLTDTPDHQEYDPELSPDGTKLAFISDRPNPSNEDGNYEIFTLSLADGTVTQVTDTVAENPWDFIQSYDPTWSPDGSQIAFNGYRQWSSSEIFTIDADGTGDEQLLTDPLDLAQKWEPDWSPDGTEILYTWGWDEFAQDLHVIDLGTGEVTNLTPEPDPENQTSERNGVWSPDGTRIAFRTDRHCCGIYPNVNAEIYVMEYPSGILTRVTEHEAVDEDPAWSPDGSQITFTSLRNGAYDLFVVDAPPVPPGAAARSLSAAIGDDGAQPLLTAEGDQTDPFWAGTAATGPTCRGLAATKVAPAGGGPLQGTSQRDVIVGSSGPDTIKAMGGNDVVCARGGRDAVAGGAGPDVLLGQAGPDTLNGALGNDELLGGKGTDVCRGGGGTDSASGCESEEGIP
jgi:Tol biopolymer transport system component